LLIVTLILSVGYDAADETRPQLTVDS